MSLKVVSKLEFQFPSGMTLAEMAAVVERARDRMPASAVVKVYGERGTVARVVLEDGVDDEPRRDDRAPHSEACWVGPHNHGPSCSPSCPTCQGRD